MRQEGAAGPAATTATAGVNGMIVPLFDGVVATQFQNGPDCLCPDGYPQCEEIRSWIRVVKHTGECEHADSLQVHDTGEWITVWGE